MTADTFVLTVIIGTPILYLVVASVVTWWEVRGRRGK